MFTEIRPGITGNDLKLAHVAEHAAWAIRDNGDDPDASVARQLTHGHECRLFLGDGGPEIVDPGFWIADDEAPLFRAMVDVVLSHRPGFWDPDDLIRRARRKIARSAR